MLENMRRKTILFLIPILVIIFGYAALMPVSKAFASEKPLDKITLELISAAGRDSIKSGRVDTTPIVISGVISIGIDKTPSIKDAEKKRYLIEYFMDGKLVYQTDGTSENSAKFKFDWEMDTTKYANGKHKIVVNFWDKEGPSAIGVVYVVVENPVSIEEIKKIQSERDKSKENTKKAKEQ